MRRNEKECFYGMVKRMYKKNLKKKKEGIDSRKKKV
jgi:hypothetical protein